METLTHTKQVEQLVLPEWETPVITHLEIKVTMYLNGSGIDGLGNTGSGTVGG